MARLSFARKMSSAGPMFRCPHCRENGLRFFEKAFAAPGAPARCRFCGGLAYPNALIAMISDLIGQTAMLLLLVFALVYSIWWLTAIPVVLCFFGLAQAFSPATATDAAGVRRVRRLVSLLLVIGLICAVTNLFLV